MIMKRVVSNFLQKAFRRKFTVLLVLVVLGLCMYRYQEGPTTAYKYSLYMWIFGEGKLENPDQATVDYIAQNVKITTAVLDNIGSGHLMGHGGYTLISVTLTNSGPTPVPATRWQLFGYMFRIVEPSLYPYKYGIYFTSCGLKLYHVASALVRFEPSGGGMFTGLDPGAELTCTMKMKAFQVSKTDSFPNWFVTGTNLVPKTVLSTVGEDLAFVSPFIYPRQYLRRKDDPFHPYTASERYQLYSGTKESVIPANNVIPTPLEAQIDPQKRVDFNTNSWKIVKTEIFLQESRYLAETMKMQISNGIPAARYIHFVKGPVKSTVNGQEIQSDEGYSLETDPAKMTIKITAKTNKGAFYGIQTLRSLAFTPEAKTGVGILVKMPALKIVDAPRFEYRGLHIDVSRNFHTKQQLLKTIEVMSLYKMNKLHLHLTDDEGWRLEIPGLPELTQIGSKRCYDPDEEQCIMPMLGSGPNTNTSGTGYYDTSDYKEILTYARLRHIDVIPEFDMPGHSRAAIKSLHAKSQQSHRRKMNAEVFSVLDDDDHSKYLSGQGFSDDVMNPCVESTYTFVRKLMMEVKRMHDQVQPLKMFHFGGDEVASGAWSNSTACKQLQHQQPELKTEFDLMKYFIVRVASIAKELGVVLGAWEDGVISHGSGYNQNGVPFRREELQNNEIYAYIWKRPSEVRTPHRSRLLVNSGYKVVLAYGSYLYFDHPYEPDPEERGLYWATRKISTRDVWDFTPDVMNADVELPCPSSVRDKTDCYQVKHPENIVGMQAQLWTETVRTSDQMDYMLFPRLLAMAERAWHRANWEGTSSDEAKQQKHADWLNFINIVGNRELRRLENLGVSYRVPPPGAIVRDKKLSFSTEFPGLDIEYYSEKESVWLPVQHNMPITSPMKIRTRSYDKGRFSRVIIVHPSDSLKSSSISFYNIPVLVYLLMFIVFWLSW